jgi:hypothetical protein
MATTRQFIPTACKDELIIKEVEGETLVYDLKSHKAHCLNKTAALVWKHCDGKRTVEQVTRKLEAEVGKPVPQEVVWIALDQLERLKLLQAPIERASGRARISRREAVRRLGITTAVALPLVTSILAPEAVQAASVPCGGNRDPCDDTHPCCKGFNCDGVCFPN